MSLTFHARHCQVSSGRGSPSIAPRHACPVPHAVDLGLETTDILLQLSGHLQESHPPIPAPGRTRERMAGLGRDSSCSRLFVCPLRPPPPLAAAGGSSELYTHSHHFIPPTHPCPSFSAPQTAPCALPPQKLWLGQLPWTTAPPRYQQDGERGAWVGATPLPTLSVPLSPMSLGPGALSRCHVASRGCIHTEIGLHVPVPASAQDLPWAPAGARDL